MRGLSTQDVLGSHHTFYGLRNCVPTLEEQSWESQKGPCQESYAVNGESYDTQLKGLSRVQKAKPNNVGSGLPSVDTEIETQRGTILA